MTGFLRFLLVEYKMNHYFETSVRNSGVFSEKTSFFGIFMEKRLIFYWNGVILSVNGVKG